MKSIVFNTEDLDKYFAQGGMGALLNFSGLEEMILVEDFRPPPKESNRRKSFATQLFESLNPPTLEPPRWLKVYSESSVHLSSQYLADHFRFTVAEDAEFKKLENVKIYFTQVY
jgi:hypothetical protein